MCLKCEKLRAEKAPPEAFPSHKNTPEQSKRLSEMMRGNPSTNRRRGLTREQRAAEAMARLEVFKARQTKVPAKWADAKVRRVRFFKIRELLGLTHDEYAELIGISRFYYTRIQGGYRPCNWTHLKLAERELRIANLRQYRTKEGRRKRVTERLEKRGIVIDMTQAVLPDDAKLRAKAVKMHLRGKSEGEIACNLALRPEVVRAWIESIG